MTYADKLNALPDPLRPSVEKAKEFARQLELEERMRQRRVRSRAEHTSPMNIMRLIEEARRAGDLDEALWRAFLATHFGTDFPDSASKFVCAFGEKPVWTWSRVFADLNGLEAWLVRNQHRLLTLRFSNHRKMEAKQAPLLFEVIRSFVDWVHRHGGSPQKAFSADGATPEDRFDEIFSRLLELHRVGRLAAFDMLCLLHETHLVSVKAGSCYLKGATGPVRGAEKLWGKRPTDELANLADETARRLGAPYDMFEDALCNWQKERRRGKPASSPATAPGRLSTKHCT